MVHYEIECENVFTEQPEKVDLYFHLTEAELTMLKLGANEAYSKFTDEGTGSSQKVEMFQKLIKLAYGQKADNGQFVKSETVLHYLEQSDIYVSIGSSCSSKLAKP